MAPSHQLRWWFLLFVLLTTSLSVYSQTAALQFVPVAPCRIADTRGAPGLFGGPPMERQSQRDFPIPLSQCNIPNTAAAYSLNVTVVPWGSLGYLTIWPTGQLQPVVSTLNSYDGRVKANAAIVPAGSNGAVTAYVTNKTDLILDINGYFKPADATTLAFYPLTPCRVADTRWPSGALGGPSLHANEVRSLPLLSSSCNIPGSALAYSLNMTVVPRTTLGYLTVWPTGQDKPFVSTLNAPKPTVVANAAIVPAGTGRAISVYVTADTDLIVDINGYFAAPNSAPDPLSLYSLVPCRLLDTRPPGGSGAFSGTRPVDVLGSACNVPAAQAYVFNATVVPNGGPMGYLSLWPDTVEPPVVSTLNAYDGAVTSNMAVVPTLNGYVDAFASNSTHLLMDIFSYFATILPLRIVTATLPAGTVNHPYSTTLVGGGGVPPYQWTMLSGSLPPGLNLNSGSGVISGVPTMTGDYGFSVLVNDSQSPPISTSAQLAIRINPTPTQLTISSSLLPDGRQNEPYISTLEATGGQTPYGWSVMAGGLPAGLALNSSTGAISGAPRGAGSWNFTVQVSDAQMPPATANRGLSVTIAPAVPLRITTSSLPSSNVGSPYSAAVAAVGGVYPYTWAITSGSLPTGLSFNTSTGAISGTPTVRGTWNFTAQITDSETPPVHLSAPLSITINAGIVTITTSSLPAGRIGTLYNATLTATGGLTPYTWTITAGSLPAGLTLYNDTGVIRGVPTVAGTSEFTIKVTDAEAPRVSDTAELSITIQPPLRVFAVLHSFTGPDGHNPDAPLVLASDGNIWGTTYNGGAYDQGTVFKITPSGTLTTVFPFCNPLYCGGNPVGMVRGADGNFYGATSNGGSGFAGTIYRLTPSGYDVLYNFCSQGSCLDGRNPQYVMQASDGNFYGVNAVGGTHETGDFYQLKANRSLTVLYSFNGSTNGSGPFAALVQGRDGQFYGMAPEGGAHSKGTVFKITANGTFTLLHSFCEAANCTDGASPYAGLALGSDGNLYGTTSEGGTNDGGTVFKITPSGTLTTLYAFAGLDGAQPRGGLVQAADGNFYGTTYAGGAWELGTVFQITPGGALTTLHSFQGADGMNPTTRLLPLANGYLYGTTHDGGANNYGSVFSLAPSH